MKTKVKELYLEDGRVIINTLTTTPLEAVKHHILTDTQLMSFGVRLYAPTQHTPNLQSKKKRRLTSEQLDVLKREFNITNVTTEAEALKILRKMKLGERGSGNIHHYPILNNYHPDSKRRYKNLHSTKKERITRSINPAGFHPNQIK